MVEKVCLENHIHRAINVSDIIDGQLCSCFFVWYQPLPTNISELKVALQSISND